jgi:hypothetical protein
LSYACFKHFKIITSKFEYIFFSFSFNFPSKFHDYIRYFQYPSVGSSTLGENFNPAKDCSDIVENLPEAKDGFYWIKHTKGKGKPSKVPDLTKFGVIFSG